MESGAQGRELSDDQRAAVHRQLFAAGDLSELAMTGVALEALERADLDFFLQVANVLRQSEDPVVLERTGKMLDTYADLAEGEGPEGTERPEHEGGHDE